MRRILVHQVCARRAGSLDADIKWAQSYSVLSTRQCPLELFGMGPRGKRAGNSEG